MAAEVRPERAGNKSKVFFIWIAKMPVNFTYGLAFHFAGCSAEIKQKGKSTQKGFLFNSVVPTLSLLRYHCRRRTHNQRQQPSVPPPVLQLGVLGGHQGLKSSQTANQRCWCIPRCGSLHAPCWWDPALRAWYQWWWQLRLPETVILPFCSVFQIQS